MEWVERRDGDFLVADNGKILGRVMCTSTTPVMAEVIYAGGGSHKNSLGDYISNAAARAAVEQQVQELGLDPTPAAEKAANTKAKQTGAPQ